MQDFSIFTAPITRVNWNNAQNRSHSLSPTRQKLQFEVGIAEESEPSFLQTGTPICGGADTDQYQWQDPDPYRARAANMLLPPSAPYQPAMTTSDWPPPPPPPGYQFPAAAAGIVFDQQPACKMEPVTPAEHKPYGPLRDALRNMDESLKHMMPPVPPPKPAVIPPLVEERAHSETRAADAGSVISKPS